MRTYICCKNYPKRFLMPTRIKTAYVSGEKWIEFIVLGRHFMVEWGGER